MKKIILILTISVCFIACGSYTIKDGKKIYIYERGSQFELLSQINESYMWVSPIPEEILIRHQLVQKKCVDEKHIYRDMLIKRNNLDVYKNQMSKWFLNEIEKSIKHILS